MHRAVAIAAHFSVFYCRTLGTTIDRADNYRPGPRVVTSTTTLRAMAPLTEEGDFTVHWAFLVVASSLLQQGRAHLAARRNINFYGTSTRLTTTTTSDTASSEFTPG